MEGLNWLSCPSSLLLEQTEHIFHTGTSSCAPVPIPAIVASNIAGCLHLALFERVARNAPSYRPPPRPVTITMRGLPPISPAPLPQPAHHPDPGISFDPHLVYARVISLLATRLRNTRRFSVALDDNLIRLHPGIEPWLAENGMECG